KALTFDDVLLLPAHSTVVPRDVSLQTRLTSSIVLNIPLLSAAMDTVTEARLAIAIAQEGGMGIVHKNMPPRAQAAEVATVKLVTVAEGTDLEYAKSLMHRHRLERVLVVNDKFELKGLITVKDILKATEHPNACKDELGQLRVGAALGTGADTDERAEALVAA